MSAALLGEGSERQGTLELVGYPWLLLIVFALLSRWWTPTPVERLELKNVQHAWVLAERPPPVLEVEVPKPEPKPKPKPEPKPKPKLEKKLVKKNPPPKLVQPKPVAAPLPVAAPKPAAPQPVAAAVPQPVALPVAAPPTRAPVPKAAPQPVAAAAPAAPVAAPKPLPRVGLQAAAPSVAPRPMSGPVATPAAPQPQAAARVVAAPASVSWSPKEAGPTAGQVLGGRLTEWIPPNARSFYEQLEGALSRSDFATAYGNGAGRVFDGHGAIVKVVVKGKTLRALFKDGFIVYFDLHQRAMFSYIDPQAVSAFKQRGGTVEEERYKNQVLALLNR